MSDMYRIVSKHKQKTIFCIGNGNAESNLNNLFQFLQIFSCQKTLHSWAETVSGFGSEGYLQPSPHMAVELDLLFDFTNCFVSI